MKKSKVLIILSLLIILIIVFIIIIVILQQSSVSPEESKAAGNTYYVATTGKDTNAGTEASPWKTIQHAANIAVAGDIIYIRGGTYSESVDINKNSGSSGKPITFKNYNGEVVKIDGGSVALDLENVSYIIIDGINIISTSVFGIYIHGGGNNIIRNCITSVGGQYGVFVSKSDNNIIEKNDVSNGKFGIMVCGEDGPAHNNIIRNNKVHDNYGEGIYLRTGQTSGIEVTNTLIENNEIYNNPSEAIQNTDTFAPPAPNGTIIRGNVIHDNTGDFGVMDIAGDNILIENNLIYNNKGGAKDGIAVANYLNRPGTNYTIRNNVLSNNDGTNYDAAIFISGTGDVKIYNNTIYKQGGYGIMLTELQSPGVTVKNNILSQNTSTNIKLATGTSGLVTASHNLFDGGSTYGTNVVTGDPLFVSPSTLNFRLQAGSPAIDKGTNVGITKDKDGTTVPIGAGPDIGAYEYSTGVVITTTGATPTPIPTPTTSIASIGITSTPTPTSTTTSITQSPNITPFTEGDWEIDEFVTPTISTTLTPPVKTPSGTTTPRTTSSYTQDSTELNGTPESSLPETAIIDESNNKLLIGLMMIIAGISIHYLGLTKNFWHVIKIYVNKYLYIMNSKSPWRIK